MTDALWKNLISALPEKLTVSQVSRILRRSPNVIRIRLAKYGYEFRCERQHRYGPPKWSLKANWNLPNIDIARKFDISRERVRAFREKLGKPKVEARGRRV